MKGLPFISNLKKAACGSKQDMKSDNLQYNTLVRWFAGTNDSSKLFTKNCFNLFTIKKIMLGTSDAWSTSHLSQQTRKPAYYIVD